MDEEATEISRQAKYLSDAAFKAKHRGPRCEGKRLPSRKQILRMCEAIRRSRWRPTGPGWSPPSVKLSDVVF